jgi:xanthine dehydrogenase accessory factor
LVLEVEKPSFIRSSVAFGRAIYDKEVILEESIAIFAKNTHEINSILDNGNIAVTIDPKGKLISKLKPLIVIDAILAKKNLGTTIDMAPITIGLGPGFVAKKDVDIVIETMRGHDLGRLIFQGAPMKNTGVPGLIGGYCLERVIYSDTSGIIRNKKQIGDIVAKDDIIATIENAKILAPIDGILRGIIRDGYEVPSNFKIADIDPRIEEVKNCFTISDKARTVGGAALEGALISLSKLGVLWKEK